MNDPSGRYSFRSLSCQEGVHGRCRSMSRKLTADDRAADHMAPDCTCPCHSDPDWLPPITELEMEEDRRLFSATPDIHTSGSRVLRYIALVDALQTKLEKATTVN